MGALSIYLMPEGDVDSELYGRTVKQVLLDMGVILDKNYEEPDWWVAGPASGTLFEDAEADEPGFEYCILYASKHVDVVPQDPAEFPSCPSCGESISEEFYDVVNDILEENEEEPAARDAALREARVECSECNVSSHLTQLKTDVGIFLSGTWVNFEDPPGSLREDWLTEFNARTGWTHRCLEYWYT